MTIHHLQYSEADQVHHIPSLFPSRPLTSLSVCFSVCLSVFLSVCLPVSLTHTYTHTHFVISLKSLKSDAEHREHGGGWGTYFSLVVQITVPGKSRYGDGGQGAVGTQTREAQKSLLSTHSFCFSSSISPIAWYLMKKRGQFRSVVSSTLNTIMFNCVSFL